MSELSWIKDEHLFEEVDKLLKKAKEATKNAELDFGKNVIDPFYALFEMAGFDIKYDIWLKNETTRQAQKTLQNHIGVFHQNILGHVDGWDNKGVGNVIDLVCDEKKIIAEIKNKYNTISGGKLADLYTSLNNLISPKASIYKGYKAYYVAVIPKSNKRVEKPFTPSDKEKGEKCPQNENIREIDGASFYSLVTGNEEALRDLYTILPEIIYKCSEGKLKIDNPDKLTGFFNAAFE